MQIEDDIGDIWSGRQDLWVIQNFGQLDFIKLKFL